MSVTKNFVFITAFGMLVVVAAFPFGLSFPAFVFFNLLFFSLLVLDLIITPAPSNLFVSREVDNNLYFKAENVIRFLVKNKSIHALSVEAKEDGNRFFRITDMDNMKHNIPAGEQQIFSYVTIPSKRGSFMFENIFLRYKGLLGLCRKYAKIPSAMEYKVYPNIKDLSKYRLLVQKNKLLPAGDNKTRRVGLGFEFESLRPYVEGDDYRKINWAATAREMKHVVNTYQVERSQPVNILIDIGRPMSYASRGYKKLDYAINAAIILADIVNQQGAKAGLVVFDSKLQSYVAPGQGAMHRNHLLETLYKVEDNRQIADYYGAFKALCDKQKRRSLVFIFTDFEMLEEGQELISNIAWLKRKHLPIVVFMKNDGLQSIAEAHVAPSKKITYKKVLRDTAKEFASERKSVFVSLSAMGVPNIESPAEDFALAAVNNYIRLRG